MDEVVYVAERIIFVLPVQGIEHGLRGAPAVERIDRNLRLCGTESEAVSFIDYGLSHAEGQHTQAVLGSPASRGVVIEGSGHPGDIGKPVAVMVASGDVLDDHGHLLVLDRMAGTLEVFAGQLEIGRCPDGLDGILELLQPVFEAPRVGDHRCLVDSCKRLEVAVLQ